MVSLFGDTQAVFIEVFDSQTGHLDDLLNIGNPYF